VAKGPKEVGDRREVFDRVQVEAEKRRTDLFRHWSGLRRRRPGHQGAEPVVADSAAQRPLRGQARQGDRESHEDEAGAEPIGILGIDQWDSRQKGWQTSMSEDRPSIAELIEALRDGDFQARNGAAVALGELGPQAAESVPALTRALEAEDKYLRSHTARALGKIGPAARTAVPALTRVLKDKDEDVRGEAAAALGHIGAEARVAVGDLVELLKDRRKAVRRQAARALRMLDPETAARHLGLLPRLRRWFQGDRPKKPR
jgi:hypothetical protein